MPRKERLVEEGQYHIINRGVERRNIYLEDSDYEFFMELMLKVAKDYHITIHAFCLMSNHYHILLETKQKNLSKAVQFLNDKYAKYFNKKYQRTGHLWQGRYKSYPLFDDAHFWIVAKYIERNPIKAGMVNNVSDYKFQSYFLRKSKSKYITLINDSMLFDMTLDEYANYVDTDLIQDAIDIVYDSPNVIIKDDKIKVLNKRLKIFFKQDTDINRNDGIKKAYEYGYTKSEIAKFLNLSPSTISRIVK